METVGIRDVVAGDVLSVARGELFPVDVDLPPETGAQVALDWITGESRPVMVAPGGRVQAGAFLVGTRAVTGRAVTDYCHSTLAPLLTGVTGNGAADAGADTSAGSFWQRVSKSWVSGVLAAAGLGFFVWLPQGGARAMEVAVSLLVVTCPCAIGVAWPLASEFARSRMRQKGFFTRRGHVLDRLHRIRHLVFDKTGTLTLGGLSLRRPEQLSALKPETRSALGALVAPSGHPVAVGIDQALGRTRLEGGLSEVPRSGGGGESAREVPGRGLELTRGDGVWRLGQPAWALSGAPPAPGAKPRADQESVSTDDIEAPRALLTKDGHQVAAFDFDEPLRPGVQSDIQTLVGAGYSIRILSGDAPGRVAAVCERLALSQDVGQGNLRPVDKAASVSRGEAAEMTMMLGDGVNDALAFDKVGLAGTVAIDRPVLPGRSDFFLVGDGLQGVVAALVESHHLLRVRRWLLGFAIAYNVLAVGVCFLGWMTPLRAAVSMPLSSLVVVSATVWAMRRPRQALAVLAAERLLPVEAPSVAQVIGPPSPAKRVKARAVAWNRPGRIEHFEDAS